MLEFIKSRFFVIFGGAENIYNLPTADTYVLFIRIRSNHCMCRRKNEEHDLGLSTKSGMK